MSNYEKKVCKIGEREYYVFETEIGGRTMSVEIGKYAEQANGSCFIRCGETCVMVNATLAAQPRDGIDFFPLGVDFEEKMYSVGKIPGGFKKREGRPSDKAILTSRLIDRPIRPLFPKGFLNDVAVVATAMSVEPDIQPEVFAMIGSSIALSISDIPFAGPTGSVVVGLVDGKLVINPDAAQRDRTQLTLNLSGTKDAIMMVEAGANEISEQQMLEAIMFGHEEIKKQCDFIEFIVSEVGKTKIVPDLHPIPEDKENEIRDFADDMLTKALDTFDRAQRQKNEDEVNAAAKEHFAQADAEALPFVNDVLYKMTKEKVRARILNEGIRPDGRKTDEIRHIWCENGVLPRVHGSGVFTRGMTQVITTATLGTISEVQKLESLDDDYNFKRYMHHYNMPPYSTGEAKQLRSPGRREIGHGALAEKALLPVIPSVEEFPYAFRVVSLRDTYRQRGCKLQRKHVAGEYLRLHACAYGCGSADKSACGGHCHGTHEERRRQKSGGFKRYSGLGGFSGRHGLQGCRHEAGNHRNSDGYKNQGNRQEHSRNGFGTGEKRKNVYS